MQYLLLIYGNEREQTESWEKLGEEEQNRQMAAWYAYTGELEKAGVHVAGEALQPTGAAKTVRVDGGELLVTDGPFAETKEQLGGYYVVDVDSEQAALDWAAKMPSLPHGSVEVRPIMVFPAEMPA
ncbi:MAG TPA: YciI family protein [Gaiellaceae bacterium]|nr:YciI family protein [Gaiellaceae bacterium]